MEDLDSTSDLSRFQEEQKFLEGVQTFGRANYFKSEDEKYKDKVIHQLLQKKNDLEDELLKQKQLYELRIKNLEASLDTLKEHIGSNDARGNFNVEQLQQTNKFLQKKLSEQQKAYQDLVNQNQELKRRLELSAQPSERVTKSQDLNNMKELIVKELLDLKKLIHVPSKGDLCKVREALDEFVESTVNLDECYYSLLELVDQKILKKKMQELEQMNKLRRDCLGRLNEILNGMIL